MYHVDRMRGVAEFLRIFARAVHAHAVARHLRFLETALHKVGIFAGLVFDRKRIPRYSVVTYVRRGGLGGGAAADISAAMAKTLMRSEADFR